MNRRRALALDEVRTLLEHHLAQLEPVVRAAGSGVDEASWRAFGQLHWCVHKALPRAERAGVGAVLAADEVEALEQLDLLGEQLHWQERRGTVPRVVTQDAVAPYWTGPHARSAAPPRRDATDPRVVPLGDHARYDTRIGADARAALRELRGAHRRAFADLGPE